MASLIKQLVQVIAINAASVATSASLQLLLAAQGNLPVCF
jgi:hypothetical protein